MINFVGSTIRTFIMFRSVPNHIRFNDESFIFNIDFEVVGCPFVVVAQDRVRFIDKFKLFLFFDISWKEIRMRLLYKFAICLYGLEKLSFFIPELG